jgi:hypothetical protein
VQPGEDIALIWMPSSGIRGRRMRRVISPGRVHVCVYEPAAVRPPTSFGREIVSILEFKEGNVNDVRDTF